MQASTSTIDEMKFHNSSVKVDFENILTPRKLVECRICQEEEEDLNMKTPCSCCGSLKEFKHGYTAPTPLFQFGCVPMHFRGNWDTRRELHGSHYMAMISSNHVVPDPDYEEYSVSTTRNLICCPSVAVILLFLRIAGIVLPVYAMTRAVIALQRRRRQLEPANLAVMSTNEAAENSNTQPLNISVR